MNATILLFASKTIESATSLEYVSGGIVALFVFAYLIYSLIKPEKF